jgi:hypothetical protein
MVLAVVSWVVVVEAEGAVVCGVVVVVVVVC